MHNTEGPTVTQVSWYCIWCLREEKCKSDTRAFLFLQCQFVIKPRHTQFYNSPFTYMFGASSFAFSSSSTHSRIFSQRECKSQALTPSPSQGYSHCPSLHMPIISRCFSHMSYARVTVVLVDTTAVLWRKCCFYHGGT